MKKILLIFAISVLILTGCSMASSKDNSSNKSITVCAAASLKDALVEIQPGFEEQKNIKLVFNFASSGTLEKQIEEGAPADLFISAGKEQMDKLQNEKLIDGGSRSDLLCNKLVLVVSNDYRDRIKDASDLKNSGVRISIGEPDTVPAGLYAKESLTNLKLWDDLKGSIVYGKDVKQVLTYVEDGDVAAGVVYLTDTVGIKNSFICLTFDDSIHDPIVYPAAVVSQSKNKDSAGAFMDYLKGTESGRVFQKYGFTQPEDRLP